MSKRVPSVVDFLVRVHPGFSNPDLVPLKQVLIWEAIRQVAANEVAHAGARYHLHGAAA